MVIGQEYTDFDKGLDDGIEGDVFGFNFVLEGTTSTPVSFFTKPTGQLTQNAARDTPTDSLYPISHPSGVHSDRNVPTTYFARSSDRASTSVGFSNFPQYVFEARIYRGTPVINQHTGRRRVYDDGESDKYDPIEYAPLGNVNSYRDVGYKPLGLELVQTSFSKCRLGRGAPLNNKHVLVNWRSTPVRVFGGAILKNVKPFC